MEIKKMRKEFPLGAPASGPASVPGRPRFGQVAKWMRASKFRGGVQMAAFTV
jgi:hypothetical protein